jgi:hypothetical protein
MLPILVAAGWWWWTWPERTARRFVELLNAGDLEGAKAMIDGPQPSTGFWKIVASRKFDFNSPVFQPASRREHLQARRLFYFDWQWDSHSDPLGPFLAKRNRIMLGIPASSQGVRLFYVYKNDAAEALARSLQALYPAIQIKADVEKANVLVQIPEHVTGEFSALMLLFESEQPP